MLVNQISPFVFFTARSVARSVCVNAVLSLTIRLVVVSLCLFLCRGRQVSVDQNGNRRGVTVSRTYSVEAQEVCISISSCLVQSRFGASHFLHVVHEAMFASYFSNNFSLILGLLQYLHCQKSLRK